MRFLVDAQLPKILATRMNDWGYECIHTNDLPAGNSTTDKVVAESADVENRILISKDADFINSHLLLDRPAKLLLISTGNISNYRLLLLFENHLDLIISAFLTSRFVELTPTRLVIHD